TGDNGLGGLAPRATNDVWAVGGYGTGSGTSRTLALHWDGTAWTQFQSADPSAASNGLVAATVAGVDTWAVGASGPAGTHQTLIERLGSAPCATATATATAPPSATPIPPSATPGVPSATAILPSATPGVPSATPPPPPPTRGPPSRPRPPPACPRPAPFYLAARPADPAPPPSRPARRRGHPARPRPAPRRRPRPLADRVAPQPPPRPPAPPSPP